MDESAIKAIRSFFTSLVEFLIRSFVMESNGSDADNRKSSVKMVVTVRDTSLPDDDIKSLLCEHFSSCGMITKFYIPTDVEILSRNKYAFLDINGEDAKEKALQLNESDLGGSKLLVKVMPPSSQFFEASPELYVKMAEGREYKLKNPRLNVIMVSGFDTSLDKYKVEDQLKNNFAACGEINVVRVNRDYRTGLLIETATIYILGLRHEVGAKSWALNGTDMGGWKAKVSPFVELQEINFNTCYGCCI